MAVTATRPDDEGALRARRVEEAMGGLTLAAMLDMPSVGAAQEFVAQSTEAEVREALAQATRLIAKLIKGVFVPERFRAALVADLRDVALHIIATGGACSCQAMCQPDGGR